MPCPTCSHTLESFVTFAGLHYLQCPRCGTSVVEAVDDHEQAGLPKVYVPKLVERCLTFMRQLEASTTDVLHLNAVRQRWRSCGVEEAILPPELRT